MKLHDGLPQKHRCWAGVRAWVCLCDALHRRICSSLCCASARPRRSNRHFDFSSLTILMVAGHACFHRWLCLGAQAVFKAGIGTKTHISDNGVYQELSQINRPGDKLRSQFHSNDRLHWHAQGKSLKTFVCTSAMPVCPSPGPVHPKRFAFRKPCRKIGESP